MSNYFLKLDGVNGACTISGFEKCIEVEHFSHNCNQPASPIRSSGGGGTTSKAYHSDITVSKSADASTPEIQKQLWTGDTIATATLTLCRMDGTGKATPYLEYELQDCVISNHSISGGGGTPIEKFSIAYATIKTNFIQQSTGGEQAGNVPAQQSLLTGEVQ